MKCKKCLKNFRVLTKEELCAICYQKAHGTWPLEFSNYHKDKDGKLVSKDKPMKFQKDKKKK